MAHHSISRTLCAFSFLVSRAFSHMQMADPSPLRDPHSNRADEPKDWSILNPLHADGSDFTCKGYQWNTPLTPTASYTAGKTYELRLSGSATHGGGSCQISLSCDNGVNFKVLRSIIGGCPLQNSYDFAIPKNAQSGQCLLAWTWFNKIGNREMYMNCAVVDIVGSKSSKETRDMQDARSVSEINASSQLALKHLPDLYVANLKNINSCTVTETFDAVFPNPGAHVTYGDGVSPASGGDENGKTDSCTGQGRKIAGGSIPSTPSFAALPPASVTPSRGSYANDGGYYGPDGNWHIGVTKAGSAMSSMPTMPLNCNDGQWHPSCYPDGTIRRLASSDNSDTSNDDSNDGNDSMDNMDNLDDVDNQNATAANASQVTATSHVPVPTDTPVDDLETWPTIIDDDPPEQQCVDDMEDWPTIIDDLPEGPINRTLSPAPASAPVPATIVPTSSPEPAATLGAQAQSCFPTYIGDSDPDQYLPCQPGALLCKSETQFYMCGQFDANGWTFGRLSTVAPGMSCVPRLVKGTLKMRRRDPAKLRHRKKKFDDEGHGNWFDVEVEDESGNSHPDTVFEPEPNPCTESGETPSSLVGDGPPLILVDPLRPAPSETDKNISPPSPTSPSSTMSKKNQVLKLRAHQWRCLKMLEKRLSHDHRAERIDPRAPIDLDMTAQGDCVKWFNKKVASLNLIRFDSENNRRVIEKLGGLGHGEGDVEKWQDGEDYEDDPIWEYLNDSDNDNDSENDDSIIVDNYYTTIDDDILQAVISYLLSNGRFDPDTYPYSDTDDEPYPFKWEGPPLPGFTPVATVSVCEQPIANKTVTQSLLNITHEATAAPPFLPFTNTSTPFLPTTAAPHPSLVNPHKIASILPWLMGPGPVVPSGKTIHWPGPRVRPTTGPPPAATTAAAVESVMGEEARRSAAVKRQACPPVPPGNFRADAYVTA